MREIAYEEALTKVRDEIDRRFGGVEAFLSNTKELKLAEIAHYKPTTLRVYLSRPNDQGKATKSAPVLCALYKYFFGVELQAETWVTKAVHLFLPE